MKTGRIFPRPGNWSWSQAATKSGTIGVDGYEALQLSFDDKNEKHSNKKAALGHF
jgi:hypothetical protein